MDRPLIEKLHNERGLLALVLTFLHDEDRMRLETRYGVFNKDPSRWLELMQRRCSTCCSS